MSANYLHKYKEIYYTYKQSLLTKDQIYDTFEKELLKKINE